MRSLALVTGASRPGHGRDRDPGRVAGFLARLDALGPVDLVVVHDDAAPLATRRSWLAATLAGRGDDARVAGLARSIEVAAPPLRPPGVLRELHHGSDTLERAARATTWFRLVDSFVAAAPAAHDLVWCADLAALTRAGWIRRALPAVVDVDRFEDLGSVRSRRAARRTACVAHLVTVDEPDRRDLLALPGSLVVTTDEDELSTRLLAVVDESAAYRPARTA